jgi:hypothetical protein
MYICTHICVHVYVCIHKLAHAYTHKYIIYAQALAFEPSRVYEHIHTYIHMHIHTYLNLAAATPGCTSAHMSGSACVCVCMCMYVSMCVCVYIYIYIYTHTHMHYEYIWQCMCVFTHTHTHKYYTRMHEEYMHVMHIEDTHAKLYFHAYIDFCLSHTNTNMWETKISHTNTTTNSHTHLSQVRVLIIQQKRRLENLSWRYADASERMWGVCMYVCMYMYVCCDVFYIRCMSWKGMRDSPGVCKELSAIRVPEYIHTNICMWNVCIHTCPLNTCMHQITKHAHENSANLEWITYYVRTHK